MKSISQVAHLTLCPETLEEARTIIADQQEQLARVRDDLRKSHDGLDERDDLRTENAKLREAVVELIRAAPLGYECDNFDHRKQDRHKFNEPCPCLGRWQHALSRAEQLVK